MITLNSPDGEALLFVDADVKSNYNLLSENFLNIYRS